MRSLAALLLAGAVIMGINSPAQAGSDQGNTLVKVLGTEVLPSGDFKGPLRGSEVDDNVVPSLSIAYFLTPNIAVEAICCFTQHSVYSPTGAKIVDTWIVPATVSLQYHVPMGAFKPYVGVGVSYMAFFSEKSYVGAPVDLEADWGLSVGGGLDVALGGGWQLSLDVKKVFGLDSKVVVNGTNFDTAELDPWLISLGVGYRFNLSDLLGSR